MKTYPIPMVPGPVKLPQTVLDVYQTNFGSADLEAEFLELYNRDGIQSENDSWYQKPRRHSIRGRYAGIVECLEKLSSS